jgi:flavin-dependent dehydrogenase
VNILGAGPSRLCAAINLAKAGYDVEVFEKRHRVGQRFNGDLQGLENWSGTIDVEEGLGEIGIRTNFDLDAFHELTLTNMTKGVHFSLHRPAFYLVKRGPLPGTLDYGLASQARDLESESISGVQSPRRGPT